MANPVRGEISIALAGEPLNLRPSFDCLVQIEQLLGRSIIAIARAAVSDAGLTITEMATIIKCGADAWAAERNTGDVYNQQTIARLVLKEGVVSSLSQVVTFLESAILGGAEAKTAGESVGKAQTP